jgi:hypothetical protein
LNPRPLDYESSALTSLSYGPAFRYIVFNLSYIAFWVQKLPHVAYLFYGCEVYIVAMRSSILILLFFAVLVQPVSSAGMLAYGVARFGGEPVASGSLLSARIVDSVVGNCTVGENGVYSMLMSTDRLAQSPIEFYVVGGRAVQVVPFASDSIIGIDLDFRPFAVVSSTTSSTTLFSAPSISGNAVAITVGDNVIFFLMFLALLSIAYSVSDILV